MKGLLKAKPMPRLTPHKKSVMTQKFKQTVAAFREFNIVTSHSTALCLYTVSFMDMVDDCHEIITLERLYQLKKRESGRSYMSVVSNKHI